MLSPELALGHVHHMSCEELRKYAKDRLWGDHDVPVGDARLTEPAEDVLIQVARHTKNVDQFKVILDACRELYDEVDPLLSRMPPVEEEFVRYRKAFIRLCRWIEFVVPESPELRRYARRALDSALLYEAKATELVAATQAFMAFHQSEADVPMWEELLRSDDGELAAFAFNAIVDIDPHHPRVAVHLRELWIKCHRQHFDYEMPFLARRMVREQGTDRHLIDVLSELANTVDVADGIRADLEKQDWSRPWIEHLEHPISSGVGLQSFTQPSPDHGFIVYSSAATCNMPSFLESESPESYANFQALQAGLAS